MFEDAGFSVFYLISQVFAFFSIVFDLIAAQRRKKADLLKMDTMAAFCSSLHYAFLGAWSGLIGKIITTIRNGTATYRTVHKKKDSWLLPIIFVASYIVMGLFAFESVFSVIPILAPSIYTVVIYKSDIKMIRYAVVLSNALWLIYDIYVMSVVGMVAEVIVIINALIAICRYRNNLGKKR